MEHSISNIEEVYTKITQRLDDTEWKTDQLQLYKNKDATNVVSLLKNGKSLIKEIETLSEHSEVATKATESANQPKMDSFNSSQLLVRLKHFVRSSESTSTNETTSTHQFQQPSRPAFISGSQVKRFYETTIGKEALEKREPVQPKDDVAVKPQTSRRKSKRLNKCFNVNLFMRAVESGDSMEVERILEDEEVAVDCRDQFGWTALMCACRAGHLQTVKLLLQRGADVSAKDKGGNTCTKLAETAGHTAVINLLKELRQKPIDVEQPSTSESKSFSPFFCEVCKQQVENSSYKKHLSSTIHNFYTSSKRRMPTMYGIPESNRGFQILVKSGWDKEAGLGPSGEGHKFPPKTILKQDRTGLGVKKYKPRVTHTVDDIKEERTQKRFKTNIKSAKQKEQRLEISLRRMLT